MAGESGAGFTILRNEEVIYDASMFGGVGDPYIVSLTERGFVIFRKDGYVYKFYTCDVGKKFIGISKSKNTSTVDFGVGAIFTIDMGDADVVVIDSENVYLYIVEEVNDNDGEGGNHVSKSTIFYNNKKIATIPGEKIATIPCKGKKMAGNIVVKGDSDIKYKGATIATLSDGQTATIPCNGKIMQDNITVLAKKVYPTVTVTLEEGEGVKIYDGNTFIGNYAGWEGQITSGYIRIESKGDLGFIDYKSSGEVSLLYPNDEYDENDRRYVFEVFGNGSIEVAYECFVEGTQITLATGDTKAVENVTYDDELLVWDFYNGKYEVAKPFWIMQPAVAKYYYKITLSNGNIVNLVGSGGNCHRVFSVSKNKFEYATKCVGDDIYTENGIFKLVSCEKVTEIVRYYNLKTEKYHNCFANGILTCGRFGNMYDIANMKYCSDTPNFTETELAEREAVWEKLRLPR